MGDREPLITIDGMRKILIRSTNWIGDAVMTTPALGAVKTAFPGAEMTVVAPPLVAELLSPHPFVDRVIVFDRKGPHRGLLGFWRFCRGLREKRFDLAILLQNAVGAAGMARLARIPRCAGFDTDGRGFLLTHRVHCGPAERRLHHTDYYLSMLRGLGIEGGDGRLILACTEYERRWALEFMGEGMWVAVNAGAAFGSAKRWLPDRFAAVADAFSAWGWRVVLTGGPAERDIGAAIESAMRSRALNVVGKTTVRQLVGVLSQCRFMVTNDSGPMHMGAALGVPLVALFGPTDHTTTSPLAQHVRIVRRETPCAPCLRRHCPTDRRCMDAITVDDVLTAAQSLLCEKLF